MNNPWIYFLVCGVFSWAVGWFATLIGPIDFIGANIIAAICFAALAVAYRGKKK